MQSVCKSCFSDKELVGFITSQGKIGNCDCCNNKTIEVIKIEELLEFFNELLGNFKKDINGVGIISKIQGNWSLFSSLENGKKILNYILSQINTPFYNANDLVDFTDEIYENINYWSILKEQLKWERRYLTDINRLIEDLGWDGFFNSKIVIQKNELFYRARLHHSQNEPSYPSDKMFCPPKEISTAGRANPSGIPYLYLSDNKETILYEIRASFLDEVSIATFSLKDEIIEEIKISDFTESPTLFHPNEVNKRIKSTLLKSKISIDLSNPMRRYDSELDYIPTQFICEFIKVFTGVQGIKFASSLHTTGRNLVLFNQNIMQCIDVKKLK